VILIKKHDKSDVVKLVDTGDIALTLNWLPTTGGGCIGHRSLAEPVSDNVLAWDLLAWD
jgi:hypothetical protein